MKRNELDTILKSLEKGYSKKKIRKERGISTTVMSNRLRKLEDLGLIRRSGKFKVDVLQSSCNNPRVTRIPINTKLNKRGHAFNFKVLFPSEENLIEKPKVKEFINKNKKETKILPFGSIQFKYKRYTIWINKKSLTIYSNGSYYAENALHSKFYALKDVDNVIRYLMGKFGFTGRYGIEIFREHYGLIFNKFAKWLLERNRKLSVKNKGNKVILWVDDSLEDDIGLKEFEGKDALDINKADERYFKENEETNWSWSPKVIANNFNIVGKQITEVTQNQLMFNKNFESHVEAIQTLSETVKELRKEIKRLNKLTTKKLK